MTNTSQGRIEEIQSLEDVPEFEDEAEEAAFWDTHTFSDELWDELEPINEDELPPVRPAKAASIVRLDLDTERRLRALARKKGKGYQTLLKEFVVERLYEEEKREGIVGG